MTNGWSTAVGAIPLIGSQIKSTDLTGKETLKNIVNCEINSMLKGGGILMWSLSATETWLLMSGSEVSGTHTGMCFFFFTGMFFPSGIFFSYRNVFFLQQCFFFLQECFSYMNVFLSLIVFCKDVVGNALNLFKNNSDNNTTTSTNYLV